MLQKQNKTKISHILGENNSYIYFFPKDLSIEYMKIPLQFNNKEANNPIKISWTDTNLKKDMWMVNKHMNNC